MTNNEFNILSILHSSIERDDAEEFKDLIFNFMDTHDRSIRDGEYFDITQAIIKNVSGKCYVAVSNLMRLDEDRSYHAKTIEMLEEHCQESGLYGVERYVSAIETIFKAYIKNTNYLRCFNVIHGALYIGSSLQTSEILELYLNLGLDTKKKIDIVFGLPSMDLQEYLEYICIRSFGLKLEHRCKKSLDMLINFKIKKEREIIDGALPYQESKLEKIDAGPGVRGGVEKIQKFKL